MNLNLGTTASVSSIASFLAAGVDRALLEELFDHTLDIAFFIKDSTGRYSTVNNTGCFDLIAP